MFQVIRYKQNIVKHDVTDQMICSYETTFLQYVRYSTDQDLATVDGKNTHHGLGSIAIVAIEIKINTTGSPTRQEAELVRYCI